MHSHFYFKTFNILTDLEKGKFFDFCRLASLESTQPASENMWNDKWTTQPNTLPYILEFLDRFSNSKGQFFILFCKDQIIGCSGVYVSDFSNSVAIAGVRTWIDKNYRHQSLNRDYFLPIQKKWAMDHNLKIVLLTFNDYNKNIINIFKRTRLGERQGRIESREPHHLFFNGLNELEFPITAQFTRQWGIYEKLDPNWEYDWELIRSKEPI